MWLYWLAPIHGIYAWKCACSVQCIWNSKINKYHSTYAAVSRNVHTADLSRLTFPCPGQVQHSDALLSCFGSQMAKCLLGGPSVLYFSYSCGFCGCLWCLKWSLLQGCRLASVPKYRNGELCPSGKMCPIPSALWAGSSVSKNQSSSSRRKRKSLKKC